MYFYVTKCLMAFGCHGDVNRTLSGIRNAALRFCFSNVANIINKVT